MRITLILATVAILVAYHAAGYLWGFDAKMYVLIGMVGLYALLSLIDFITNDLTVIRPKRDQFQQFLGPFLYASGSQMWLRQSCLSLYARDHRQDCLCYIALVLVQLGWLKFEALTGPSEASKSIGPSLFLIPYLSFSPIENGDFQNATENTTTIRAKTKTRCKVIVLSGSQ